MNQIEQWFGLVQRKRLRISDFTDLNHLAQRLMAFVAEWNQMLILSIGQPNRLPKSWPSAKLNLSWLQQHEFRFFFLRLRTERLKGYCMALARQVDTQVAMRGIAPEYTISLKRFGMKPGFCLFISPNLKTTSQTCPVF